MHDGATYGQTGSAYHSGLKLKRDPDERFWGTISSTVTAYDNYQAGIFTEEDYKKCLEINCKAVKMTPEELNDFVTKLTPKETDINPETSPEK